MQSFQWTGELTIFLPEIDAEHREILRLCEELQRALCAGADSAQVQPLIRQLAAEAEAHFTHEERMMRTQRYSGYAWHKQQHDAARRNLKDLAQNDPGELPAFVVGWVHDHAAVADRMMAASLRNAHRRAAHALTATKKVRPSPKPPDIPRSSAS